jgi:hypothetical protein
MGILGVVNRELAPKALVAIRSAGAAARTAAWGVAGDLSSNHGIIAEFQPSRLGLHKLAVIETESEGERKEKRIREVYFGFGNPARDFSGFMRPKVSAAKPENRRILSLKNRNWSGRPGPVLLM